MKTKNPYGMSGIQVLSGSSIVDHELSQVGGKAKARYPDTPLGPSQKNNEAGKMKTPAYTPGTTPAGS